MSNRLEEIKLRWAGLEGTHGDIVYLLRRLEAAEAIVEWAKTFYYNSYSLLFMAWEASKEEPDAN